MTFIVFVVVPLVFVLFVLIFKMNRMEHFTPQAYYRQKVGGAPVAGEYEALGPRMRKQLPGQDGDGGRRRWPAPMPNRRRPGHDGAPGEP